MNGGKGGILDGRDIVFYDVVWASSFEMEILYFGKACVFRNGGVQDI